MKMQTRRSMELSAFAVLLAVGILAVSSNSANAGGWPFGGDSSSGGGGGGALGGVTGGLKQLDPTNKNSGAGKAVRNADPTNKNSGGGQLFRNMDPTNKNGGLGKATRSSTLNGMRDGQQLGTVAKDTMGGLGKAGRNIDPTNKNGQLGKIVKGADPTNKNSNAGKAVQSLGQSAGSLGNSIGGSAKTFDPFNKNSAAGQTAKNMDVFNKNSQASTMLGSKAAELRKLGANTQSTLQKAGSDVGGTLQKAGSDTFKTTKKAGSDAFATVKKAGADTQAEIQRAQQLVFGPHPEINPYYYPGTPKNNEPGLQEDGVVSTQKGKGNGGGNTTIIINQPDTTAGDIVGAVMAGVGAVAALGGGGGGGDFFDPGYSDSGYLSSGYVTPASYAEIAPIESTPPEMASPINLISSMQPNRNPTAAMVTVADAATVRKIAQAMDDRLEQRLESLKELLAPALWNDDLREDFLKANVRPEMDSTSVNELKNSLIDNDADGAERAAKKLGIRTAAMEPVSPRLRATKELGDLKKAMLQAESVRAVDASARRFNAALGALELDRSKRFEARTVSQEIYDELRVRIDLDSKVTDAGKMAVVPLSETSVVFYPPLAPAGKVFQLPGGSLAVGAGQKGDMAVGTAKASALLGVAVLKIGDVDDVTPQAADAPPPALAITIPTSAGRPVAYTLNGYKYQIGAGQSQNLDTGSYVIEFDRGAGRGKTSYTLSSGIYEFVEKDGGLDLQQKKFNVNIVNPSRVGAFNYIVNGQPVALPAGAAQQISSLTPVVVAFDHGDGTDVSYKKLSTGTYLAAIDEDDGKWDLFDTSRVPVSN